MLLIQADQISFAYYTQASQLLEPMSFQLAPASRIGLIGANGAGKSTLLKLLLGELQPDKGRMFRKPDLKIGCLPQEPMAGESGRAADLIWALRPDLQSLRAIFLNPATPASDCVKALERYENRGGYRFEQRIDRLMNDFGWDAAALEAEVSTLSGGEKTRLALLRLALDKPALLLLDEPTNHLDQPMLDWLEDFLVTTRTPWLMVSHDRHILEGCVETIWELEDGKLTIRRGNYSSYRRQKAQELAHQEMLCQQQHKKVRQLEQVAAERRQIGQGMENFKPSRSVRKNGGICKRDDGSVHVVRPANVMRSAKAAEHRAGRLLDEARANQPQRRRELKLIFRSRPLR
ncbi:MAG: ATP-binding cassette domain-containing protein, partial [Candidatus Sericytochromatia bacterium]